MIDALIGGKIASKPERRQAKDGKPFAVVRLSVPDREGCDHLVQAIAFDPEAVSALLALDKGDAVSVAGELSAAVYQPEGKEPRTSLRLLVHGVLSAYVVKRKREAAKPERQPARCNPDDPAPLWR